MKKENPASQMYVQNLESKEYLHYPVFSLKMLFYQQDLSCHYVEETHRKSLLDFEKDNILVSSSDSLFPSISSSFLKVYFEDLLSYDFRKFFSRTPLPVSGKQLIIPSYSLQCHHSCPGCPIVKQPARVPFRGVNNWNIVSLCSVFLAPLWLPQHLTKVFQIITQIMEKHENY